MRLTKLRCKDVKGWEGVHDWTFGDIVVVSGDNGEGKSSFLHLITGLFGSGNPRILRPGASDGFIEATLVDDKETWVVARVFRPGKVETPVAKSSRTGTNGAPATFLKQIVDAVSVDPINQAMLAKEDRQVEILLETLPLTLAPNAIDEAVGDTVSKGVLRNAHKMQALDAIASVSVDLESRRRDANRDAKAKRIHAEQLRGTIPAGPKGSAGDSKDWHACEAALFQDIQNNQADRALEARKADHYLHDSQMSAHRAYSNTESDIVRWRQQEIAKIDEQVKSKMEDAANVKRADLESAEESHKAAMQNLFSKYQPEHDRLTREHAQAKQMAEQQAGFQQTRKYATDSDGEADALELNASAMTIAMDKLKELRINLLKDLPIEGLEVMGGMIYLGGVPLSERNTAERAKFWIRIAARRAQDLGIVVFDGAEMLGDKNFEAVIKAACKTGLQWFFGRRTNGPLEIKTIDVESEVVA